MHLKSEFKPNKYEVVEKLLWKRRFQFIITYCPLLKIFNSFHVCISRTLL